MQYALLIYGGEDRWDTLTEDESAEMYRAYNALTDRMHDEGKLLVGQELQSISTATAVRVRDGETIVSDGPFAETKEALGGFYLIEAETLDEALDWASQIPGAEIGTIEVRPVVRTRVGAAL